MGNWEKLKRANLKNGVNVRKQPPEMLYILSQWKSFPVNIAKFFKNNYFKEHMRVAASDCRLRQQ